MTDTALSPERILETAEEVLRRFGPAKATVVDVARALGVSHGSVYRHFSSKAALRDAVVERWLARASAPLAEIAAESGPATARLKRWLDALVEAKRKKVLDDPELFATYRAIIGEAGEAVARHVEHLHAQLTRIIAEGMIEGVFVTDDAARLARAVFSATGRFHNPAHAHEWSDPGIRREYEDVWGLVLGGLRP